MDYSVKFHNLITDIGINPKIQLKQARFTYSQGGGVVNPANGVTYPEVRGVEVFCHLKNEPGPTRKIQEPLEIALYMAEEIFTGLVAVTQGYCYLAKPITCTYDNKNYVLEDSYWREYMHPDSIFRGGESFLDDASFIDEDRNFHPMYHFYRAAKDETNSNDYRALNAWRFLEALHGTSDTALVKYLIEVKNKPEDTVNNFYKNVRNAVTHAKLLKKDPYTDSVILPRSMETQFDGGLMLDTLKMIDYLDNVVADLNPLLSDIRR